MNRREDQSIAFITGANAGIGLELTRKLLAEGWQVIALNRSDYPAGDETIGAALALGKLRIYKTNNLADYSSLRSALKEIKEKEQQIDILFNNAGGSFHELSYSKQGRELHFELLTVVPFIILMELTELLKRGRLKTVINTSSSAQKWTKQFTLEKLEHPKTFRKLLGPYATSKLALSLWTEAIAPQLAKDGIRIRSVDPGGNNTLRRGKKSGLPFLVALLMKLLFPPPSHGASKLYEGAIGEHRDKTGVFLMNGRVAALTFQHQAQNVLKRVTDIYEHEFSLYH
ncbi:short-chain dehydrogenase [Paenibacillus oryzae]|uniref:Short-chain dehydrogenase n=1 Tax=Paenibacillus oryzae TaxID=1844972 RepID=A0A1A5YLV0_9BACL|nr:SDR family NAD(P)-dependent oxidoreductase [Paenibacillus oryzae]OBR66601.1 short-chain dehydrogenase [Paenibacillus oryzae]